MVQASRQCHLASAPRLRAGWAIELIPSRQACHRTVQRLRCSARRTAPVQTHPKPARTVKGTFGRVGRNAKLVAVDPRFTRTAAVADVSFSKNGPVRRGRRASALRASVRTAGSLVRILLLRPIQ